MRLTLKMAAGILAAGLLAAASPAFAQGKITCKFGVLGNTDFPGTIGMQRMADRVNAESKGALEIGSFPALSARRWPRCTSRTASRSWASS